MLCCYSAGNAVCCPAREKKNSSMVFTTSNWNWKWRVECIWIFAMMVCALFYFSPRSSNVNKQPRWFFNSLPENVWEFSLWSIELLSLFWFRQQRHQERSCPLVFVPESCRWTDVKNDHISLQIYWFTVVWAHNVYCTMLCFKTYALFYFWTWWCL